ncbi:hypothetical protein ACN38_g2942 [Penicillium nordicum]|uniref:Uncharacterized protein n=1 Tax=Penicillium nordicum TaxID=229535 RepID=A0A0M8P5Z2_9EURO|nr:hypothetical protein ACN38_g2942 [Penicillium nordicum]
MILLTIRRRFSGYVWTDTEKTLPGTYGYFVSKDGESISNEAKLRDVGTVEWSCTSWRGSGTGGRTKKG